MTEIIHKELSYAVRGVMIDVHNKLGPMLPEEFYQEAIAFGLTQRGIACEREKEFHVFYQETDVGSYYVDHWLENGKILLELKITPAILPLHRGQAIAYLKVTNADLAIVASYGAKRLIDERLPNFLRNKTAVFTWEQRPLETNMLYPELTNRLIKLLHEVHFELGPGFLHQIYRRAIRIELRQQNINYDYIKELSIYYDGHFLGTQAVRLIRVEQKILIAAMALKTMNESLAAQLRARLRHIGIKLGLLANFHGEALEVQVVRLE